MSTDLLSPEPRHKPITAATIRAAMAKTWVAPEYALLWEVSDATGTRGTRSADALIMSLWPSRGLELHGIEIKVSRSDWKREAANPKKAETIAAYCDRWWIHTGPNVIHDLAEVPLNWGWREFDGSRWKTKREAGKVDAKTCDRAFLAALLRRSDEALRAIAEREVGATLQREREGINKRVDEEVTRRTQRVEELRETVANFEKASGLSMRGYMDAGDAAEIGALVKAIREAGIQSKYGGLTHVLRTLRSSAERIEEALSKGGFEVREDA